MLEKVFCLSASTQQPEYGSMVFLLLIKVKYVPSVKIFSNILAVFIAENHWH